MCTDRKVTKMSNNQVANKDEQWPSSHEADCEQNDRRLWKHYLPLRSVNIFRFTMQSSFNFDSTYAWSGIYLSWMLFIKQWEVSREVLVPVIRKEIW